MKENQSAQDLFLKFLKPKFVEKNHENDDEETVKEKCIDQNQRGVLKFTSINYRFSHLDCSSNKMGKIVQ